MTPTPALYRGTVRHTRLTPFHHSFAYRVYNVLVDIDRLDELDGRLRLFSVDRFNVFSLARSDHGPADGGPLRPWVDRVLADAGVDLEGGAVMLLTYPRVLGYVFNPISVWYGFGPDGDLRAALYEVRNTFGSRHTYVAPIQRVGLRHDVAKQLHVSPFNDMDDRYRFALGVPDGRVTLGIDESRDGETVFRAGMALERMAMTDGNLARLFLSHPLLTLKVIGGIHWQALKLWLRGARYRPVPDGPSHDVTIVERERTYA
jgi:DUF1365 family protein